jgi:hypothetical protein
MIPSALVTSSQHLHQQRHYHAPRSATRGVARLHMGDPQRFLFWRYLGRWRQSDYLYILVQLVSAVISLSLRRFCGLGNMQSVWFFVATEDGGAYTAKARPQSDLMPGFVHT